jgi:hypothetical protein
MFWLVLAKNFFCLESKALFNPSACLVFMHKQFSRKRWTHGRDVEVLVGNERHRTRRVGAPGFVVKDGVVHLPTGSDQAAMSQKLCLKPGRLHSDERGALYFDDRRVSERRKKQV